MQKDKINAELGLKVHHHLVEKGVEIPMETKFKGSHQEKIEEIKSHFSSIMQVLGLDLEDDSLMDTPNRVAKMYMNEIFYGLDYDNFPKCTTVENKMKYDELVIEKDITCISNCEHHFVVIDGFCHIGYIPGKNVLGLSKLNRIVDFFAKRPQIQERLTEQIYYALQCILETDDIAVVVEGVHYCVKSRGIRDTTSSTITSKMGGRFRDEGKTLRKEFLSLITK
jgi:GTP cyclohydrolase I